MRTSKDTILTTHVGSMPRTQAVADMLFAEDQGKEFSKTEYDALMAQHVTDIVGKQHDAGVDIPSDGETSKISYATYIRHRLTGFEIGEVPRATPKDLDEFPEFRDRLAKQGGTPKYNRPICCGPIEVKDHTALHKDIANLKAAQAEHGIEEAFMNAASPGVIAVFQPNQHYKSHEDYLEALSEGMRTEYETIVEAGLILQLDCPDLAMGRHIKFRDESDEEFLRNAELQIEALNYALQNIPSDRVRMHICWGNYEGPHTHDISAAKVLPVALKANVQGLLFEGANPRHAHEWAVWQDIDIPEDKILIPGVIDTTTNFVEHPELVAQRIERFANIVGPERVIAATDCGFGTFAGFGAIHPSICWAKLKSLRAGADIAAAKLL